MIQIRSGKRNIPVAGDPDKGIRMKEAVEENEFPVMINFGEDGTQLPDCFHHVTLPKY